MRLVLAGLAACVAGLAAVAAPAAAAAQPEPTGTPQERQPVVAEPVPGEEQCTIADPQLTELSGLVATDDGYIVVNDGTNFGNVPITVLDQSCQVVRQFFFPFQARDPEDLALDREADVLWVADTGDNAAGAGTGETRPTAALWRVDLAGDPTPVIHRFAYPDGPRDAEALLLDGDGMPIIVTKQIGTAELYKPTEQPRPNNPHENAVPLEKVGEFSPPETGTSHATLPAAAAGRVITGAANAPDGSRVVLRTYTDAFEFDVTGGDVVAAITTGEPRITPLPDEPLAEAISYSPDGERFLTVSEAPPDSGYVPVILAYTPAPPAPEPVPTEAPAPPDDGSGGGLFSDVQDIVNLIAAVGVIGLILLGAGVFGIVRARRRAAAGGDQPDGEDLPATGRARLPNAPWDAGQAAGSPADAAAGSGGVYTSGAARGWEENGYGTAGAAGEEHHATPYAGGEHHGTPYAGGEYHGTPYAGGEYHGTPYGGAGPGTEYRGTEYGGTEYRGTEYGGAEYGGAARDGYEHPGTPYEQPVDPGGYPPGVGQGQAAGYQDQPFDQDWPHGYAENGHSADHGRGDPAHGDGGRPQGGTYSGGTYQSQSYSDDPDYPYEFRERGQW